MTEEFMLRTKQQGSVTNIPILSQSLSPLNGRRGTSSISPQPLSSSGGRSSQRVKFQQYPPLSRRIGGNSMESADLLLPERSHRNSSSGGNNQQSDPTSNIYNYNSSSMQPQQQFLGRSSNGGDSSVKCKNLSLSPLNRPIQRMNQANMILSSSIQNEFPIMTKALSNQSSARSLLTKNSGMAPQVPSQIGM